MGCLLVYWLPANFVNWRDRSGQSHLLTGAKPSHKQLCPLLGPLQSSNNNQTIQTSVFTWTKYYYSVFTLTKRALQSSTRSWNKYQANCSVFKYEANQTWKTQQFSWNQTQTASATDFLPRQCTHSGSTTFPGKRRLK